MQLLLGEVIPAAPLNLNLYIRGQRLQLCGQLIKKGLQILSCYCLFGSRNIRRKPGGAGEAV